MESLLAIMLFLFCLLVVLWLFKKTIDASLDGSWSKYPWGLAAFIAISLLFWGISLGQQEQEKVGPCIEEAIGTMYDPNLKMVRTYTYCKQRGKWQD